MRTTNGLSNAIVPSVTLGRSCVTVNEPVMRGCSANAAAPPSSGTTLPFQVEGMLPLPDRPTHVPLVCARAKVAADGNAPATQAHHRAQRERPANRRVTRIIGNRLREGRYAHDVGVHTSTPQDSKSRRAAATAGSGAR